ncbi:ferredoxin [Pseudonocardia broussonetiae]|uniref:Ferredoxin n=1 Tax=Pseudonocardia broussonetiae TaxID=2736640 RepID=A0A6M6JRZ0_9PSEU|nr:(4Fe-4S)-binding protein [Pseudonocardia broussonetiae]QJY50115.1 ferredoxin [Pseudonocardia broussonetiae]
MEIIADRDLCIGAGLCVTSSEAVFDQDDDGIVLLLVGEPEGADADAARQAVSLCPSGALRVEE